MRTRLRLGQVLGFALFGFLVAAQGNARRLSADENEGVAKGIGVGISVSKDPVAPSPQFQDGTPSNTGRKLHSAGCSSTQDTVEAVVDCTNAVRANPDAFWDDYGCNYPAWRHEVIGKSFPHLSVHGTLTQVAQLHSDDQAQRDRMGHDGSDGSSLGVRVDRTGFDWSNLGENVAVGFTSAKEVVMAWMCSPTHRKNLMGCSFNLLGIGCSYSNGGKHFFTQNFGCAAWDHCECNHEPPPSMSQELTVHQMGMHHNIHHNMHHSMDHNMHHDMHHNGQGSMHHGMNHNGQDGMSHDMHHNGHSQGHNEHSNSQDSQAWQRLDEIRDARLNSNDG